MGLRREPEGGAMQTRDKLFDDLSQLMTNAAGMAQGVKTEAETAMKSWIERWLADANLVTRDEFDAVREMAAKAREENESLAARIAGLEARLAGKPGA
jgi:BMFP domain-containing protein YqiC